MSARLLFDIGATKTRLVVSDGEKLGEPVIISTHQNFDEAMRAFVVAAQKLLNGARPDTIIGGVAGPLDRAKTMVAHAPNLRWSGQPLKKTLEDALGAPVTLENDAALAGLGEAMRGAGRGKKIVVYLTISTGVGGARIVNGAIDANVQGFEPGQQIIDAKTRLTLEQAVSGSGIERRFGAKPQTITNPALWEELAETLAVGIHNSIVHWSPDIVILGGSMITGDPAISLERVRAHFAAISTIFPELTPIEKSAFGDPVGLYGALALSVQG